MNDYKLDDYVNDIVDEIIEQADSFEEASDLAHEYADGSEHVIYYHKAHDICQNCDTAYGEEFIEDVGPGDDPTYDSIAVLIAYGELRGRIMEKLTDREEELEAE